MLFYSLNSITLEVFFPWELMEWIEVLWKHNKEDDLKVHPRTWTGQVEPLKGYDGTVYSRCITKEHRLVYKIYDEVVEVLVLSAFGHYR